MTTSELSVTRPSAAVLQIRLAGSWQMEQGVPDGAEVERALHADPPPRQITFDTQALGAWDSALLMFLARVGERSAGGGVTIDRSGLPQGVQRLMALAEAVPERAGAKAGGARPARLARIGDAALAARDEATAFLAFLGSTTLAAGAMLRGTARFRMVDLMLYIQQAGAEALPIVTLISFLVGVIMAFVGAVQLQKFGAAIYVADLVGIAVVREMGAMMTGIVMAGRTGAAFAAQLGTMKVTQEVDALTTMGIDPMEFLVLPRVLALCLMMPLLCLYSNLIGIVGGSVIATGMLGLSLPVRSEEHTSELQSPY